MPHVSEHTPKVSTRLVNPYARESSREKRQQDRQTHRRIVQNHFSRRFEGCTSKIRSYLEVDFLHDANTSIDLEVKWGTPVLQCTYTVVTRVLQYMAPARVRVPPYPNRGVHGHRHGGCIPLYKFRGVHIHYIGNFSTVPT